MRRRRRKAPRHLQQEDERNLEEAAAIIEGTGSEEGRTTHSFPGDLLALDHDVNEERC
jgi:hypothetical protein